MKTTCRLDKTFGPFGTSTGMFMTIGGIVMIYFSLSGIIVIIIGAFVGFTSTSTIIDWDKKRIRYSNNLFGIIKTGPWINVEPNMKLGIKKSNKGWQAYSRSNMPLSLSFRDYRIILYDSNNKKIMPVMKSESIDSARSNLKELGSRLGINLII
jgi:hypothetical protein